MEPSVYHKVAVAGWIDLQDICNGLNDPLFQAYVMKLQQSYFVAYNQLQTSLYKFTLKQVEAYLWEEIHSVHWKDVMIGYRHAYSFISFLSTWEIAQTNDVKGAIRRADIGLLMGSYFFRNNLHLLLSALVPLCPSVALVPVDISVLGKRRKSTQLKIPHLLFNDEIHGRTLPRLAYLISLTEFRSSYLDSNCAVVLKGVVKHWVACQQWSRLEYFYNRKIHSAPLDAYLYNMLNI